MDRVEKMQRSKVFISWSGELSKKIAFILKDWIHQVLHTIDPFVSTIDIAKGSTWFNSLTIELRNSEYGILCLTNENTKEPWLNFEAGAIFIKFDESRVCPFLYNIKHDEIDEPFKHLQSASFTQSDIFNLICNLNRLVNELDDITLQKAFEKNWPELQQSFDNLNLNEMQSKNQNQKAQVKQLSESSNIIQPKTYTKEEYVNKMKSALDEVKTLMEIKYGIMQNKIGSGYATFPKDYKLQIFVHLLKDISNEVFNDCRTIKTKYEIVIEINGETLYDEQDLEIIQKNKNNNDLLSDAGSFETRKIKTLFQIFALLKKYTYAPFKISYFWNHLHGVMLHRFVIRYSQSNITTSIPIEAVNELNELESSSGFKIELDNNIIVQHEDNI